MQNTIKYLQLIFICVGSPIWEAGCAIAGLSSYLKFNNKYLRLFNFLIQNQFQQE